MSVTNTPISGTGSNAEPIVPAEGLEPEEPLPTGDQGDAGEGTGTGEGGPTPEPGKEGEQPQVTREDGRVIPQWMRALKESNPEAYQKAKADLFEMRDRRSVHPTIQAAREEHDLVQSLGGKEGVTKLREDVGFFHKASEYFRKGDPEFVRDLWDPTDGDPIAAAMHVPIMLEEYRKHDLEGWKVTTAKQWMKEFNQVGYAAGLKSLQDALKAKDIDGATAILGSFINWYNGLNDVANKAEDPRVKALLAERTKARENESKSQQETFLKEYRTEAVNGVMDEAGKVFDSFFRGRKLDPEDRTMLLQDAVKLANAAVAADKDFMSQQQGHLDLGDKVSAVRITKARYAQALPDAVKKIARRYGYVSGTTGAGTQPNKTGTTPPAAKTEAGWIAVKERPSAESINRSVTTPDMIMSGRAILNDGKKVDWSALKKAGM
jgi:hypothetical protein